MRQQVQLRELVIPLLRMMLVFLTQPCWHILKLSNNVCEGLRDQLRDICQAEA